MRWITTAGLAAATGYLIWRLVDGAPDTSPAAFERRFKAGLEDLVAAARKRGEPHVEVNAGALHRAVGGYPGPQHHMALCCHVLREALGPDDFVIREPRSGSGPSLTLRYHLAEAG